MSQEQQILRWLRKGRTVTPMQAIEKWRIYRLAARCHGLRERGIPVKSKLVGSGRAKYASYSLEPGYGRHK